MAYRKPTKKEFANAYDVIMSYIDTEPNSRRLFHALLSFYLANIHPVTPENPGQYEDE